MPPDVNQGEDVPQSCDLHHHHQQQQQQQQQQLQGPAAAAPPWQPLDWRGPNDGYPESRDPGIMATVDNWLDDRRKLEGAEGLWRVDDNLYDLTTFTDKHPGGAQWLELTRVSRR